MTRTSAPAGTAPGRGVGAGTFTRRSSADLQTSRSDQGAKWVRRGAALAAPDVQLEVAERAVVLGERKVALCSGAVTAAARRPHQDDVAALEHVLAAVVDRAAVDLHVAQPAVVAAGEARCGELRTLGHEGRDDRRV